MLVINDVLESKWRRRNTVGTDLFASKSGVTEYKTVKDPRQTGTEVEKPIDTSNIEKPQFNFHKVVDLAYTTKVDKDDKKCVRMTRDLCRERGIDLYYIYCPVPEIVIKTLPDCYGMMQSSCAMFDEPGVKYIDTLDAEYFPNSTDNKNFTDYPQPFDWGIQRAVHKGGLPPDIKRSKPQER